VGDALVLLTKQRLELPRVRPGPGNFLVYGQLDIEIAAVVDEG